ncbi:translocation/assembly module TamB domain-containing protein, partial [Porticoccus sp.]
PTLSSTLPIRFKALEIRQLRYRDPEHRLELERLTATGSINLLGIQLDQLALVQADRQLAIEGKLGGQPPYRLNLSASWQLSETGQPRYAGTLAVGGNLATVTLKHQLLSPFALDSGGGLDTGFDRSQLGLDPAHLRARLTHRWQLENTLLPGLDTAVTSTGTLESSGTLADYRLQGSLQLSLPAQPLVPPLQLSLSSRGDPDGLSIEQLTLDSDVGKLLATGALHWREALSGTLQIDLERLRPGHFSGELSGELGGRLQLDGRYGAQQLLLNAAIEQITGELNGYPLSLRGQLGYRPGEVSGRGLELRIGANSLLLDGTAGEQLNLRWQLDASNLAALYPPLAGKLQGDGLLTGSRDQPQLRGKLRGQQLALAGQRLTRLDASFSRQQAGQQRLQLTAEDLDLSPLHLEQLSLQATGLVADHRYQLSLKHREGTLQLTGLGHWREDRWRTRLLSGEIRSPAIGLWQLEEPVDSELSPSNISLAQHCWQQQAARICATSHWDAQQGVALDLALQQLPASLAQGWLPQQSSLSGAVDGKLLLSGKPDDLRGEWSLHAPLLQLRMDEQSTRVMALRETSLTGTLRQQLLQLSAQSRLLDSGQVEASLQWPLQQGQALAGEAQLHFSSLDWLDPFVLALEDLKGRADGTVTLGGTTGQPRLSGGLRLSELSAHVPELGIDVQHGELNLIHRQQHDWQVSGTLDSGKGVLAIAGSLLFNRPDDWHSQLQLSGKDVQAVELENLSASLSPDLTVAAEPGRLSINGTVGVTAARIHLKELPASAVTVSADQVIVDEPEAASAPAPDQAIRADIRVTLGDQVQFSGFGIKGRLSGDLNMTEQPQQPARARGILEIHDGSYRTYGQRLSIDSGRLIFQGDPDRPLIHLSASRTVDNTLVGIRIDGMPDSLTSEVFATPSLPQTEAMALLITGKPLASASQADATALSNAATALGFSQSEGLTRQLQNYLGLDTLTVSSEAGVRESALTAGKYLTPRLYVGYIQDIMSPNAGMELEYSITEKLKVKAASGETQSMDVLLRIEHP